MKKVLIVDDDANLRDLLSMAVSSLGICAVDTSSGKEEAMELLGTGKPYDIVITDFRIPDGREGLTIAEKAKGVSPDTVVISISSDIDEAEMALMKANVFLTKPLSLENFLEIVSRYCDQWQQEPGRETVCQA